MILEVLKCELDPPPVRIEKEAPVAIAAALRVSGSGDECRGDYESVQSDRKHGGTRMRRIHPGSTFDRAGWFESCTEKRDRLVWPISFSS
jgi:hypothetical protein